MAAVLLNKSCGSLPLVKGFRQPALPLISWTISIWNCPAV